MEEEMNPFLRQCSIQRSAPDWYHDFGLVDDLAIVGKSFLYSFHVQDLSPPIQSCRNMPVEASRS